MKFPAQTTVQQNSKIFDMFLAFKRSESTGAVIKHLDIYQITQFTLIHRTVQAGVDQCSCLVYEKTKHLSSCKSEQNGCVENEDQRPKTHWSKTRTLLSKTKTHWSVFVLDHRVFVFDKWFLGLRSLFLGLRFGHTRVEYTYTTHQSFPQRPALLLQLSRLIHHYTRPSV